MGTDETTQVGSPLLHLRHRVGVVDRTHVDHLKRNLDKVALQRRWGGAPGGGTGQRLDRLSQVMVATERNRPLKRRVLTLAAAFLGLYALLIRWALEAQVQRWVERPTTAIGLLGVEGTILVPLLFTLWYVVICFLLTRQMDTSQPVEPMIFEVMVIYNVFQAGMSFYVAVSVLQEVRVLGLKFVGNPAPVVGAEHHRLAMMAILHLHLRILELADTFFLILRKKIGQSSSLHVLLRVQNIWGWHAACRFGCGGDIYFPVATNAICSTILHVHYVMTLLQPRAGQLAGPYRWLFLGPRVHMRRAAMMMVQVWSFRISLVYGFLSAIQGAYPRGVLALNIVQMLFGIMLHSNFHYQDPDQKKQEEGETADDDAHPAKVAFSFDSSGWCYLYHFGVALFLQEHFKAEIESGELAFSGSSGGAIVGCALAAGIDIPQLIDCIINETWPIARCRPWAIPAEVEGALETYCPEDVHTRATNRLRILLTRLLPKPPFVMGEVVCKFPTRRYLFDVLHASSHMPFIFGFGRLVGGGRYCDGLLWANAFVPWRSFGPSQHVCRVSAFSAFHSDIGPRAFAIPPFWWPAFPPSQAALEGLMWAGYRDVATIFGSVDGRPSGCCARRQRTQVRSENASSFSDTSSERVDELIRIYERTAQLHWAIFFSLFVLVSAVSFLGWLYFIAYRP